MSLVPIHFNLLSNLNIPLNARQATQDFRIQNDQEATDYEPKIKTNKLIHRYKTICSLLKTNLMFPRLPAAQIKICKPHSCSLCSVRQDFILEILHSNLYITKKLNWVLLGKLFQVGEKTRAKLFILQRYIYRKASVCFFLKCSCIFTSPATQMKSVASLFKLQPDR